MGYTPAGHSLGSYENGHNISGRPDATSCKCS